MDTIDYLYSIEEEPECPTCGRTDFASWRGVKQHHMLVHGEPLTPVSAEWLDEQYWGRGKSGKEIADLLGVEPETVRRWMKKHGLDTRDKYAARADGNIEPLKEEEWLRDQYIEERKTAQDIAKILGVSDNAVYSWMDRHGIERRGRADSRTQGDLSLLKDENWLREQYVVNGKSGPEIADEVGVNHGTVYTYLEKHGIERRSISESKTEGDIQLLQDCGWLEEQYWGNRRSTSEISEELGLGETTVKRQLRSCGIERRDHSAAQTDGDLALLSDREWLEEQYVELERSVPEIAEELELGETTVYRRLEEWDIDRRGGDGPSPDGKFELLGNRDWLRTQYLDKERSSVEIAEECNVGITTVQRYLDQHDIERRSIAEARTGGNFELLEDQQWLKEQHIEEGRTAQDIAKEIGVAPSTVITWLDNHDIELRTSIFFKDPDHLDHVVRSSWELEIAEMLHDIGVEYEYESLVLELEDGRTYTPDFVTSDLVIEVKGQIRDKDIANAEAAVNQLLDREYVVIGSEMAVENMNANYHIRWSERGKLIDLFD